MPKAKGIVTACVQRVPAKRLPPVLGRAARGMAILFEVQAGDIELVATRNLPRRGRLGCGWRHGAPHARPRLKRDQFAPATIAKDNCQVRFGYLLWQPPARD